MEILQRLKRAYKAFKAEEVVTLSSLPLHQDYSSNSYRPHILRVDKTVSDYELISSPESYNIDYIIGSMKNQLLREFPDKFFETTVRGQHGETEIEVKLMIYKNEH